MSKRLVLAALALAISLPAVASAQNLPPGIQKKVDQGGSLPPGIAKKIENEGSRSAPAVPEPGAALLFATGMAVVAGTLRRREA